MVAVGGYASAKAELRFCDQTVLYCGLVIKAMLGQSFESVRVLYCLFKRV